MTRKRSSVGKSKQRNVSPATRRLVAFSNIFSLAWIAGVAAYFFGLLDVFSKSGVPLGGALWLIMAALIIVPIIAIWGSLRVFKSTDADRRELQNEQREEIERLRRNQNDLINELSLIKSTQSDLASGILPRHAVKVTETLRADREAERYEPEKPKRISVSESDSSNLAVAAAVASAGSRDASFEADAPLNISKSDEPIIVETEPLSSEPEFGLDESPTSHSQTDSMDSDTSFNSDEPSKMGIMAVALNFGDVSSTGDWERAFEKVSHDPNGLDFVRMTEDVLDVFESLDIVVENLTLQVASGELWYRFSRGERGGEIVQLAGIQDQYVNGRLVAYMQDHPEFKALASNFQKRFIRLLESLADDASDKDFETLNDSRGGRMFVILADISGAFF